MPSFSALNRIDFLQKMATADLDLLIIGGGITGAGIALDAALRGWKVGLLEKNDFASGTSSRSTKLIHGGLRYLKQFEFRLVHETGTERAVLHKISPHLVRPEDMLLPIVEGGSLGKVTTGIALWVYDKLAGVEENEEFRMLSKEETEAAEPLFRKDILNGGALYTEYRTDDARLTLEIMKTAVQKGALAANYSEVIDFVYENEHLSGVKVKCSLSGEEFSIPAKVVVNAAGPWVDTLRQKDNSLKGKKLHLTKGVHLVVPYNKLPLRQSVYFDVLDGRMMFCVPRGEKVYIGTTDTNYQGRRENPNVTKEDVKYLLVAVNQMFPEVKLTENDIESSWAGLRPLIHEEGKAPSELSRKDEIFISPSGLISIAGGKLTGYRKMAERISDLVGEKLHKSEKCTTDAQLLVGANYSEEMPIFIFIQKMYAKFGKLEPTMHHIIYLNSLYGTQITQILEKALAYFEKGMKSEDAQLAGEIWHCLENEMTTTISDFFIRRTGKLYFDRPSILPIFDFCLQQFAEYFNWSEAEKAKQKADFMALYEASLHFD